MGQFNLHVYEASVQTAPQHNFIVLWDMKCLHSWFHKAWTQRLASLQEESSVGITWCQVAVYADSFSLNSLLFCFVKKENCESLVYISSFSPYQHCRIYFFMPSNFSSDMFWNITNQSQLWWNSDSACLVRLLFWFCVAGRVWQSGTNRTHFSSTQLKRAC